MGHDNFCEYCERPLDSDEECDAECLRLQVGTLHVEARLHVEALDRERRLRDGYARDCTKLRAEVDRQKEMRRTEREGLVTWLDRRIVQQEEAMSPKYISQETKRVMEIEVSILKRYREVIVEGGQRNEDPLMPRFSSD